MDDHAMDLDGLDSLSEVDSETKEMADWLGRVCLNKHAPSADVYCEELWVALRPDDLHWKLRRDTRRSTILRSAHNLSTYTSFPVQTSPAFDEMDSKVGLDSSVLGPGQVILGHYVLLHEGHREAQAIVPAAPCESDARVGTLRASATRC